MVAPNDATDKFTKDLKRGAIRRNRDRPELPYSTELRVVRKAHISLVQCNRLQ